MKNDRFELEQLLAEDRAEHPVAGIRVFILLTLVGLALLLTILSP